MMSLSEGSYSLVCQYKEISSENLIQTILPFTVKMASKEGEMYIIADELDIKFGIREKDKITIFTRSSK